MPMPRMQKRNRMEWIVDSCSIGAKSLSGIDKLIQFVVTNPLKPIGDYAVTIPIQIGTEVRWRIFPEFLDAELRTRSNKPGLEQFYQQHESHIRLTETPSSIAYKLEYSKYATDSLASDAPSRSRIVAHAQKLALRYTTVLGDAPTIDERLLAKLCSEIRELGQRQDRSYAASNVARDAWDVEHRTPDNIRHAKQRMAQRQNLADFGADFFAAMPLAERYLVQAMYSDPELNRGISGVKAFKSFRRDIGERSIEEYLYGYAGQHDASDICVVVSEDQRARASIHRLREQTHSTVFVVSKWGLALALKELKLIRKLGEVADEGAIEQAEARSLLTHHRRVLSRRGDREPVTVDDVLEPPIERKWAHRLVEVLKYGEWSAEPSRNRTNAFR